VWRAPKPQRQPLCAVTVLALDLVHQRGEHAPKRPVRPDARQERPQRHRHPLLFPLHLERYAAVGARLHDAEHRELKVVHPLVGEIEAATDAAEDERSDAPEARVRGHGENDRVRHGEPFAEPTSPTLADVARAGELEVTVESLPQAAVVRVDGELDMATTPELEEVIADADLSERLVVDLSRCAFLDSSAVRLLVETARAAEEAGGTVAIVAGDPGILRVLEIAAVDTMLPVFGTLDSAL
jgi:anti-sigma B factor antagonist